MAGEALRLAFPDGPLAAGTPVTGLTVRQRRLVEVLARHPRALAARRPRLGNFAMLVGEYGLPGGRAELLTYLTGEGGTRAALAPLH